MGSLPVVNQRARASCLGAGSLLFRGPRVEPSTPCLSLVSEELSLDSFQLKPSLLDNGVFTIGSYIQAIELVESPATGPDLV